MARVMYGLQKDRSSMDIADIFMSFCPFLENSNQNSRIPSLLLPILPFLFPRLFESLRIIIIIIIRSTASYRTQII